MLKTYSRIPIYSEHFYWGYSLIPGLTTHVYKFVGFVVYSILSFRFRDTIASLIRFPGSKDEYRDNDIWELLWSVYYSFPRFRITENPLQSLQKENQVCINRQIITEFIYIYEPTRCHSYNCYALDPLHNQFLRLRNHRGFL